MPGGGHILQSVPPRSLAMRMFPTPMKTAPEDISGGRSY
jgi:hypothetical protein